MTPQELKNSILQLAIQGKLVEQRPEEGTAEELYQQIQQEKQKLIREGKIKKEKPLPEITEEEKPFDIPESWRWVRMSSIIDMLSGYAFKSDDFKSNGKYKLLRGINLGINTIRWKETVYIDTISEKIEDYRLEKGDVLLGMDRPWITGGTRAALFSGEEDVYLVQRVLRFRSHGYMNNTFILLLLHSSLVNSIGGETTGISVPHISQSQVGSIAIPLPPLAEQKRIVAKIEELLPLIDRYEKAWNRLEAFNKRFPDDLQKSLLQMAIQGKLVEQRPEEGTGEELYQQIQQEKQKLIREGKIKKEKPLPEITEEEKPFVIPEGWKWVNIQEIITGITAGKSSKCYEIVPENNKPGIIKVSAVTWGIFNQRESKTCIFEDDWIEEYRIHYGDFLISRANTKKLVGACAIVNCITKKLMLSDKILRMDFYPHIDPRFILYILRSPELRKQIEAVATGTSESMKNISQNSIKALLVPLPPLAEQKRIVARLEELLPLCKSLKS